MIIILIYLLTGLAFSSIAFIVETRDEHTRSITLSELFGIVVLCLIAWPIFCIVYITDFAGKIVIYRRRG